jgi:signal transduction histidine kinase
MLQVDLIEMPARQGERFLIRLHDITMSIVNQNAVWSFQGLVRHKLSTALSQVVGALNLIEGLQLSPNDKQGGAVYEIAFRGAMRLQSELQDIFQYIETPDLIKPRHGRCCLADLPALLSEICASLSLPPIQVGYADVDDPASLWLGISHQGLELALGELIENARKFHPQQSPNVEIVFACTSDALHIHVRDDGQTLSPEQLTKAWQPYYQGERFFTGQLAGMGLGLPMVAALIWRIGGRCRIYNRNNQRGVGVELIVPLAHNDETTHT